MQGKTLGIIGGGQLGRMLTQSAKQMGFEVVVLDKTPNSPTGQVADEQIVGELTDAAKLAELVGRADVVTYEIEHIAVEPLKELADKGAVIWPAPNVLAVIQDKYLQKQCLEENGVPTSHFAKVEGDLRTLINERFSYPVVQKVCKGGYDGRGVMVIRSEADVVKALDGESYLEEHVDFEMELAVNVARNESGEIICHPVSEMVFNEEANICDMVLAPARVSDAVAKEAERVAVAAVEALGEGAVGIFAIEMFLTKDGKVLVNEIAPRPHNSGHYSIEACVTSQYEQHLRAIWNLPLGSTELMKPAVMLNILGDDDGGANLMANVKDILAVEGASLHLYGKASITPMRKIGHITVIDDNVELALEKANQLRKFVYK